MAQYIATIPILELCTGAEKRLGKEVYKWWWDQVGIELTESKKKAMAAGGKRRGRSMENR